MSEIVEKCDPYMTLRGSEYFYSLERKKIPEVFPSSQAVIPMYDTQHPPPPPRLNKMMLKDIFRGYQGYRQ